MKRIYRIISIAVAVLALSAVSASAQNNFGFGGNQQGRNASAWMDKMKSDKIAFLSSEMGLTPNEAEKFWPIYNQAEKEKESTMGEVMKAYMELERAVDAKKSDKELTSLMEKYLKAQKTSNEVDSKYVEKYKKVIPSEKIAKLFVAEEKFRRNQIMRLHRGNGNPYQPQR